MVIGWMCFQFCMCVCVYTHMHTMSFAAQVVADVQGRKQPDTSWRREEVLPTDLLIFLKFPGLLQLLSANRTIMIRAIEPCDRMPSSLSEKPTYHNLILFQISI